MFKILSTISLPFVLIYTVVRVVWSEVKTIPFFVASNVRQELAEYKRIMNRDEQGQTKE